MAWIEDKKRTDGGTSCIVRWRLGGSRAGRPQNETFGAGQDAQNRARAEGFLQMVKAAGDYWPDGWIKGHGFVRLRPEALAQQEPRALEEVGQEYVGQIVDCSPGQRSRYRSQIRTLTQIEVKGARGMYRPFDRPIEQIREADVKAWLIAWDRSLKTKANYHGLLFGIFTYALERGEITAHPLLRTAPKRNRIKQSQADIRFLTEAEFAAVADTASADAGDMLRVTVGTGMRFGEVTALWVSDVNIKAGTLRVNKAWKRDGDDGEQDTPTWLAKTLRAKHRMRGHHLGNPKTPKSKRTLKLSEELLQVLAPHLRGRAHDEFLFVTPTGLPIHNADYYERVWTPLSKAISQQGIAPFRFHDLRHTHVAWLISGGVPLPHIQARLGHESITTTIDTYGHLLPAGDELIGDVIDAALRGEEVRPSSALRLVTLNALRDTGAESDPGAHA